MNDYELDDAIRKSLEDIVGLEHVNKISADIRTDYDGESGLYIEVYLSDAVKMDRPSVELGHQLELIAAKLRRRAARIPVFPYVAFFKEGEAAA